MILSAYNPSLENLEKSYLSRSYSAGSTVLLVRNSNLFNVNDRILLGEMGNENSEIVTVSAVNADKTTITVTPTAFPHTLNDTVYVLRYDQVKIYRSTTGVDGSYSQAVILSLDVDNADLQTIYDDPSGLTSYFYKVTFFHSIKNVESSYSDPIAGSGYARKQVGTLIQEFLTEIGDLNQEYIIVPQILGLLNEANEDIIGQSRRPYRFLRKKVTASTVIGVNSLDLTTLAPDLIRLDRIKYTRADLSGQIVKGVIPIISIEEMEYKTYDTNVLTPALINPGVACAAIEETDNEVIIYPTPQTVQTDAFTIFYWGDFTYITSLADYFQTPVKRIYKLFLLSRYYRMRAKKESSFLNLSDRYGNDYNTEIVKLQRAQKVDVGTHRSFLPDARTSRGLRRGV